MSVRPHAVTRLPLDGFWLNMVFEFFKSIEKNHVSLQSGKNNACFTWRLFTFMTLCRWILLRVRNVSDKSCRENQNTHFMFSNFFPENRAVYEICGKIWWSQRGYRWQHNTAHARCMLDNYGYRHTHKHTQCITCCFSTATLVSLTRLSVTLYVHCLSCLL